MRSAELRDDTKQARGKRRERAAAMPAHVMAPLCIVLAVAFAGSAVAHWMGLGDLGVATIAMCLVGLGALAAHRTISSLAAGAGIRLAQPYLVGERVRAYVPSLGRTVDAEVVRVGAANTTLLIRDDAGTESLVVVPNSRMIRPR